MPSDHVSLQALKSLIAEADSIVSTTGPMPENRTPRCHELLRGALEITDDLLKQQEIAVAAEFFKKKLQVNARMERLGITKAEMTQFYVTCGPACASWDEAFAALRSRLKLSPDDAAIVESALIDNCYLKYKQKHGN